ncbi:TPA: hypothetical protein U1316_001172 [Streptococcus suis]|nr:hypothetical protein [Streptococcus suis]HEM5215296.1 hypothetical protein [Streptococcus suis]
MTVWTSAVFALQFVMNYLWSELGVRKNLIGQKRVRLPTPAQLIRSDLEYEIRTNLPINHCAEMLTRTLRSDTRF